MNTETNNAETLLNFLTALTIAADELDRADAEDVVSAHFMASPGVMAHMPDGRVLRVW